MEEEAEKLKQMQDEVEKQINLSPTSNVAKYPFIIYKFVLIAFFCFL